MKKVISSRRSSHAWYTSENIYCLLRLFQEQLSSNTIIPYADLDLYQEIFSQEVSLKKENLSSLKGKFNRIKNTILFNVCEDLFLFNSLHQTEGLVTASHEETLKVSQAYAEELSELTYDTDVFVQFMDLIDLAENIEQSRLAAQVAHTGKRTESKPVLRH